MLRPANGYVADFVAHLNPLSVLRAADVMRPADGPRRPGAHASRPTRRSARRCRSSPTSDAPVWAVADGAILGQMTPQAVFETLAPRG